ncbi:DUF6325 family protein [Isoptericola sp. NEAU-Y5]|uniref:DUF6325 family protein n=1 Tax=Isoptericola luteus TaxID=2879484 RepID=A0ABS7ZG61_9MICO|nr:DUF6325 family protein [Isoptericola sp. NEAU-Y5]MCA5894014.1 DUF6325 family protein [Isoptericola sp. NEAU-Y5]
MATSGPVELVLIEFPRSDFKGEIVAELGRLVDAGTVDVLDALLIRKAADGAVEWLEATEGGDDELARIVGEPAGLLAADDVDAVAEDLAPGSAVGMLVFEHSWARGLSAAVAGAGGRMLDWTRVPAEAIDELTAGLTGTTEKES